MDKFSREEIVWLMAYSSVIESGVTETEASNARARANIALKDFKETFKDE